jgi:hypothetical protein
MTHYRAQPDDDAVLIVLCAVRDGQFGKSALNEVIDLWVTGQIGRTDSIPGAVSLLAEVVECADTLRRQAWRNVICTCPTAATPAAARSTGTGGQ